MISLLAKCIAYLALVIADICLGIANKQEKEQLSTEGRHRKRGR